MLKKFFILGVLLCTLHCSYILNKSARNGTETNQDVSPTRKHRSKNHRRQARKKDKIAPSQSRVIIWDLGNTLFKVSKMGMAREIGFRDFALYKLWDGRDPVEIQKIAFNIMADLKKQTCTHAVPKNGELEIPALMCDWFLGTCNGKSICEKVNKKIEELDKKNFFFNEREKRLVIATLRVMLDPAKFAGQMKPIKQATRLLADCYLKTDTQGKPLHRLMILSNWDPESFDYLYKSSHGQRIFDFFNPANIVISGDIGLIKPDPAIFNYIIETYKLDPKNCIFIDDQQENIAAAQAAGMTGLLLIDFDYKTLREQLRRLQVL